MSPLAAQQCQDPAGFGRVALLVGGESAEREVSLDGGEAVARAFDRSGIEYQVFDGTPALFEAISKAQVDRVFNLMHGPGGEDGAIQGALQLMKIPVTGSDVLGSSLSMDKVRSKWVWEHLGMATAPFVVIEQGPYDPVNVLETLSLPLFVKPVDLGSSIGISRVSDPGELDAAVNLARRYSPSVIVEQGVGGGEYFAGVIGDTVLPLIRIETPRAFYDYEAKYHSDETRYFCPCGLRPDLEQRLQAESLDAFKALGASGWGRVDFILDETDQPWFLEVNTAPGMTDHSLVPQAAEQIGVGFDELVWRILETSL